METEEIKALTEIYRSPFSQRPNSQSEMPDPTDNRACSGPENLNLGSVFQTLENGVRVCSDADQVVLQARVVETEISVEKKFGCPNGSGDARVSEKESEENTENGGEDQELKGLVDGVSTPLIGDGSDRKLESGQNGISLVVDAHGLVESVKESGINGECEDEKASAVENGGDPGEKIPGSESEVGEKKECIELEERGENEANHNGEQKDEDGEGAVESDEQEDEDGEDNMGDEEEHDYIVGDFVWGKIRSYPWWPGQIYDPSDASEYARKHNQKGRLLVAYFGDGSFSWCSPSQLKPFAEDFEEMSKQSDSKNFVNAVQKALDEIGRLVELKMICSCVPEENRIGLARPSVINGGIKQGVLVPECDPSRFSVFNHDPAELLLVLRNIAEAVSVTRVLELTVLRSWLSAFYQAKGCKLAIYTEPLFIEGLEDKNMNGATDINGFSRPVEVPVQVPSEEDWLSLPVGFDQTNQSLLHKCPGISEDNLYNRRKKKSVAQLMKEDVIVDPNNENGSAVKDVTGTDKIVSASGEKKRKSNDDTPSQVGCDFTSPSVRKRERRKTSEILGSPKSAENKVSSAKIVNGEGDEETTSLSVRKRGRKTSKILGSPKSAKNKVLSAKIVSGEGDEKTSSLSMRKMARRKTSEILGSPKSAEIKVLSAKNVNDEGDEETTSLSVKKTGRRKTSQILESPKSAENKVSSAKNGGGEGAKETKDSVSNVKSDNSNAKEETEKASASRERKKSKYLSPPFTNVKRRVSNSSSKRDVEAESVEIAKVARVGERLSRAAGKLIGSPPIRNCSDETLQEKPSAGLDTSAISSPQPLIDQQKIFDCLKINASTEEVVSEVQSAALNPVYLREQNSVEMIKEFISAYRSAIYLNGSNYKLYHKHRPGRKRKSLSSGSELQGKDLNLTDHEIPESKSKRTRKEKNEQAKSGMPKHKKASGTSGMKTTDMKTDGEASMPVSLFVTFPPGFSLPSKNDLIAVFSKFGPLNETETGVFYNCFSARVVFVKNSDAEEAFNTSIKKSPFGAAANVKYRLRYSSSVSGASEGNQKVPSSPKEGDKIAVNPAASKLSAVDEASRLLFIKQKLEMMTSMLENSDGNMLPQVKLNLEDEMKGLLEEVSTMAKSASS